MRTKDILKAKGFTISELVVVFAIVLIVGVLMLPAIKYSSFRKGKILCANNLRQQGIALYIYAKEHDGKFPKDLKELYRDKYLTDEKIMDCPASKKKGTSDDPDYLYTAGRTISSPSNTPLVKDKKDNHRGEGMNTLYLNGTVSWKEE